MAYHDQPSSSVRLERHRGCAELAVPTRAVAVLLAWLGAGAWLGCGCRTGLTTSGSTHEAGRGAVESVRGGSGGREADAGQSAGASNNFGATGTGAMGGGGSTGAVVGAASTDAGSTGSAGNPTRTSNPDSETRDQAAISGHRSLEARPRGVTGHDGSV